MAVIARQMAAGMSDPGRKRDNNEDCFHTDPDRGIFFVIDGVGGHAAGEKAADTAYKLLRARLERQTGTVADRIREAITLANNEIYRLAQTNPDWHGMACVLTVAVVEEGIVTIGHVGDSRLYLIRSGEIRKLTKDHSPVGEREDSGEIDEHTAMRHPRRNEVYRDVGSQEHTPDDLGFIDISTTSLEHDSAILLCSDGLSDLVPSSQILAIVQAHAGNPDAAVRALVKAANDEGGKDNVTVVLVTAPRFSSFRPQSDVPSPKKSERIVVQPVRPLYRSSFAFFCYGIMLALLLVWLVKPVWRETESGVTFGVGSFREPRTWRVAGDITLAIQQAQAGDTIVVAPGRYAEQIRLKEGVNIVSERPREARLQTAGVAITAEDIRSARIEGFSIVPDYAQPLAVGLQVIDSNIEAVDLEISGAATAAIEVLGNSEGVFRANRIANNIGSGIIVRDNAKPRFVHNNIIGNGTSAGSRRPGVEVAGGAQPLLSDNLILDNGAEPIWAPHLNLASLVSRNVVAVPSAAAPRQGVRPPGRTR